jgi:hypothetical protein
LPNTQALATRYGAYGPAGDVGQHCKQQPLELLVPLMRKQNLTV